MLPKLQFSGLQPFSSAGANRDVSAFRCERSSN
jgi:hypothetical protein